MVLPESVNAGEGHRQVVFGNLGCWEVGQIFILPITQLTNPPIALFMSNVTESRSVVALQSQEEIHGP